MKIAAVVLTVQAALSLATDGAAAEPDRPLKPYLDALADHGHEPLDFVLDRLDEHDLILFDDALHSAVEPFEFYQRLVRSPEFRQRARWILLEAASIDAQPHLDAFLASDPEDLTLLHPVFQNDYSGAGWTYRTYLDLLRAIREVSQSLPESERLQVVGVSNPFVWKGIETRQDLEVARRSLVGRDHFMYRVILSELDEFRSGRKGIFLTNTRHAYTGIRNGEGRYYWNTGTFFRQWHPGRTYSIRFHNVTLSIERQRAADATTPRTTVGLEGYDYRWVRAADGLWDRAFAEAGDRPIAFSLAGTPFGDAPYAGNHMLDVRDGQTMADAYDGLIFLAPLEKLRVSATFDFIYTRAFRKELERRYRILYTGEQLEQRMADQGVRSLRQLIVADTVARPERLLSDAIVLPPIDPD